METTINTPKVERLLRYLSENTPSDYNSAFEYQRIINLLRRVPPQYTEKIAKYWDQHILERNDYDLKVKKKNDKDLIDSNTSFERLLYHLDENTLDNYDSAVEYETFLKLLGKKYDGSSDQLEEIKKYSERIIKYWNDHAVEHKEYIASFNKNSSGNTFSLPSLKASS